MLIKNPVLTLKSLHNGVVSRTRKKLIEPNKNVTIDIVEENLQVKNTLREKSNNSLRFLLDVVIREPSSWPTSVLLCKFGRFKI